MSENPTDQLAKDENEAFYREFYHSNAHIFVKIILNTMRLLGLIGWTLLLLVKGAKIKPIYNAGKLFWIDLEVGEGMRIYEEIKRHKFWKEYRGECQ